jgi:hypothetical protein
LKFIWNSGKGRETERNRKRKQNGWPENHFQYSGNALAKPGEKTFYFKIINPKEKPCIWKKEAQDNLEIAGGKGHLYV